MLQYIAQMTQEDHPLLHRLGRRIRSARIRRAWSIRLLAERSGVSPRFLTSLEAGKGNISVVRLAAVCEALEIPLHQVFQPGAEERHIIALVGLRGAGKTTIGQTLAQELNIPFTDLDHEVEKRAGLTLGEIFALHGESYYRKLERDTLETYLAETERGILSTGGGVVTAPDTWKRITERCATVWLQATPEEHMVRVLTQGDDRPMAGRENAMEELRALLRSREHLYREAAIHLSTSQKSIAEVVQQLAGQLTPATA